MLRVAAALETVYGPAPVAPAFAPGQPYPEGSMADIPDAADATPGVDLPGLCMDREPSGGVHQASSAAKRGLSERLGTVAKASADDHSSAPFMYMVRTAAASMR